ncbi:hypothetical protein SAMN02745857_03640 [Andreprevotia lacus DSM 23236]|jgi:hypothetical protein|uniref:CHAP domain-containing protein n=1 Tax=Andreprevotia lacus DSM 23236 TaxID=1121001 RepID=A0A1W1XZ26_9NEIS|nr:BPSL0067 family protein [Andreprevotia lacus]SMC29163.1 hypothetical protein SAMN02745857_03640 [Andreprevotia lacus DSM 23236]
MPYVSGNYMHNRAAPPGLWACAPGSTMSPSDNPPTGQKTGYRHCCGQPASYVQTVCPNLPASAFWQRGAAVRGNTALPPGTVIATFDAQGHYQGHVAIFVCQSSDGIHVYDQDVALPKPKPVGPRLLPWGAAEHASNGDRFYVVE